MQDSEQVDRLIARIMKRINQASGGGGSSAGGGAIASALMAQHLSPTLSPNPHPQYRLRADPIPLTTDVSGILPGANGGNGIANTGMTLTIATSGTAVVGTGTAGRLNVWSGPNTTAGYAALRWDNTNLGLIVGRALAITASYSGFPAGDDCVVLQIGQDNAVATNDSYPVLQFSHAPQVSDRVIGSIFWANREIAAAEKRAVVIEGFVGSTADSGYLSLYTMNAGALAEKVRLTQQGAWWVGSGRSLTGAGDIDAAGNLRAAGYAYVGGAANVVQLKATGNASQTANLFELHSSAAGVAAIDNEGRMALGSSTPTTDSYLRISQTFTVTSGDQFGVNAALFSNPAGASSARYFGFQGTARTGTAASVKNNQNHTGTFHGVSANVVHNGDGTMSTAIGALLAISIRSGADGTITNAYGAQISTPSLGGGTSAITSYAGLAIAATTAPGNETYVLLGTTTIPSGSYAIHSTTTFDSYLAGNLGIGAISPAVALHVADATALTNAVQELVRLDHNTSGTAAAGFGSRILYRLESSTTADQDAVALDAVWGTATHASRSGYLSIKVVQAAAALAEAARFDKSATATHTGLMLWDADNGTVERVTVGAADSGGAGFKVLRIPN